MPRTASNNLGLIERDLEIVTAVFELDGCTIEHLLQLFFPTYSVDTKWGPRTSAYARIKRLVANNYLRVQRLPAADGVGSGKYFLTIGPACYPLLEERLGLSRSELRSSRDRLKSSSVPHHLAIVDVRVALLLACQRSGHVQLDEWITERQCRSGSIVKVADPQPETELDRVLPITLVPDGAFTLVLDDDSSQRFYLELDRDNIRSHRMKRKMRGYLLHAWEVRTPVLWVVPTEPRLNQLFRWAETEANNLGKKASIFYLATLPELTSETILFGPVWKRAGLPLAISLLPSSNSQSSLPASPEEPLAALAGGR